MFVHACRLASQFTLPVVISSRAPDGACHASIGACVMINGDGWMLTTKHLIDEIQRGHKSSAQHGAHRADVRQLEQDTVADKLYRKSKVRSVQRPSKGGAINHSVWWGRDAAQLREVTVMPSADLALGRIEPFDANSIAHYPKFKRPDDDYAPGRSLCKLGFPFHNITPLFDEKRNAFMLPKGAVPLPLFPIEGMFTRVVTAPLPGADPNQAGKFIETSTPGLVGQSGGPIVDTAGAVWALQSHTRHYPLGFSPPVPSQQNAAQKSAQPSAQKEHQFLNVGMGIHAEHLLAVMQQREVKYQLAD